MRFVDGDEVDLHLTQVIDKQAALQSLRRDIEQLDIVVYAVVQDYFYLTVRHSRN